MKRALWVAGAVLMSGCGPAEEAPPPASPVDPSPPPVAAPEVQRTADFSSPAGVWEGAVRFPEDPLVLVISLAATPGGSWQGVLEAPTAGQAPPDLEDLRVMGTRVTFRVGLGSETLQVLGFMSSDGRYMAGDATWGPEAGDFLLQRTAAPAALP